MSLLLLPCLAYQLRLLGPHLSWVWRGEGARLHRRSCAFWGIVLTGPILTQAGTLIVSGSFGLDDSGAYFAAERTSNLLTFLLVAIHIVVGPRLARAFETRDFATTQRLVGLSALLAGAPPCCCLCRWLCLATRCWPASRRATPGRGRCSPGSPWPSCAMPWPG